ncbi:hypothetical protein EBR66_02855 [bacterium]|nr:hypothetical protein [bacterium]
MGLEKTQNNEIKKHEGALHLGEQVRSKFNEAAKAFSQEAFNKGPRVGRMVEGILKELGNAVKEQDAEGQKQMENLLRAMVPIVGSKPEDVEKMIGYLNQ